MHNEKWLSKKLRAEGAMGEWHLYTFENCGYPDVPDLHAVSPRGCCWIELKAIKTRQCKIPFRKGQPSWIAHHCTNGGKVYVLVLVQEDDELFLLRGEAIHLWHSLKLDLIPRVAVVKSHIYLSALDPLLTLSEQL